MKDPLLVTNDCYNLNNQMSGQMLSYRLRFKETIILHRIVANKEQIWPNMFCAVRMDLNTSVVTISPFLNKSGSGFNALVTDKFLGLKHIVNISETALIFAAYYANSIKDRQCNKD